MALPGNCKSIGQVGPFPRRGIFSNSPCLTSSRDGVSPFFSNPHSSPAFMPVKLGNTESSRLPKGNTNLNAIRIPSPPLSPLFP